MKVLRIRKPCATVLLSMFPLILSSLFLKGRKVLLHLTPDGILEPTTWCVVTMVTMGAGAQEKRLAFALRTHHPV